MILPMIDSTPLYLSLIHIFTDPTDEEAVADYLAKLLRREAFDRKGLIYGMGHAVYSISDPRAEVFKSFVGQLAHEKGRDCLLYTSPQKAQAGRKQSGFRYLLYRPHAGH